MSSPLLESLASVPAWISKVSAWTAAELGGACEDTADVIAGGADLLRRDPPPRRRRNTPDDLPPEPSAADVADAIARALAILALAPSGVTVLGRHWCTADHHACPGSGSVLADLPTPPSSPAGAAQGAYYTPRFLAEEVVEGALEPLVYAPGPLQTGDTSEWRRRPSAEICALTVGDTAAGSGAFLIAAIRYLAAHVVQAWTAEGAAGDLTAARRAVLGCVYAVDIDLISTELSKVTRWLVTFDRAQPHLPLERRTGHGDALLGITSRDQLAWMHCDPERGQQLHAANPRQIAIARHLATCIAVAQQRLSAATDPSEAAVLQLALDILTAEAKPLADLVVGAAIGSSCKKKEWTELSHRAAQHAAALSLPEGAARAEGMVPVVYAAPQNTSDWHLADPATLWPAPGGRERSRTWVMCAQLYDTAELAFTKTIAADVCTACQDAVKACETLLGAAIAVAQALARTAGGWTGQPLDEEDGDAA